MASWLILALTAVLVFVIAAVTIGRETHRLDSLAPAPAFELVDAVSWISDRLPPEVSAQVSYADVRDLVSWHLATIDGAAEPRKNGSGPDELVIVEDADATETLIALAKADGRSFTHDQVKAVLDGEIAYLRAIGAVGPQIDPSREL